MNIMRGAQSILSLLKYLAFITTIISSPQLKAIEIQFLDPCSHEPLITEYFYSKDGISVGELSLKALSQSKYLFSGNDHGFNSIFSTPTGLDAIVIEDDQSMRVYGWCYKVNGIYSESLPHNHLITAATKTILWFFAFAQYNMGNWEEQCVSSFTTPLTPFCKEIQ